MPTREPRSSAWSSGLNRRTFLQRGGLAGAGLAGLAAGAPAFARGAAAQSTPEITRQPSSATVDGSLRVLLAADFHPDHNAFMRAELEAYAAASGWTIEITDVAGFQGGGDLNQQLLGSVQAGNQPDMLIHNIGARNMHTLGLLDPMTDLTNELIAEYGDPIQGARFDSEFEDEWWAAPFFTRAGGYYVRQDIFAEAGLDPVADIDTYDKMRDAALAVSKPDQQVWGWGMSINRSGDGTSLVQNVIFRYGGTLQDETGQLVTFNSPETIAALNWLKETYTDPRFANMLPPGVLSWTDPNNNEAFLAGQIAITQNAGTMYAKAQLDQVPFADQIVFAPYPKRNSDGARLDFLSGGFKFFAITGAKNRAAVDDVVRHFHTLPVVETVWTISRGYALPAFRSGWDNPIITSDANSMRGKEIALTETDFNGLPWPGEDNAAVASIASGVYYTDMMAEIMQGRSTEEVVADYHSQFVQIYQDFGFQGE
jgi:multiple sugar transport system substrate-binding protein